MIRLGLIRTVVSMTTTTTQLDESRIEQFAGELFGLYTGGMLTFMIDKASQTITFGALPKKTLGDPDFDVSATASSGLKVTFAASGINCSISGSTVQLIGVGSCSIGAGQSGDSNYNAAPTVSQTFSIDPKPRK